MLIMAMYNQTTPSLKYVSLAEEWLPFTDMLPSATIGWATENMPGLMEEWKDLLEKRGGVGGLLMLGSDTRNGTAGSGIAANSMSNKENKPQPTADQKRAILRDMQNYSERLSVKS